MPSCPVCSSDRTKKLLQWKAFSIYRCGECRLTFADPQPTEQELTAFYQGFLFRQPDERQIAKQRRQRQAELKRLFALGPEAKGRTFLDFGAGTGVAFQAARDLGLRAYYQDLDKQAQAYVAVRFGLTEDQTVEDVAACQQRFDLVFSDNVIEHMKDPEAHVRLLVNALAAGGTLVVKTPHSANTESLFNPNITVMWYLRNALKYNSLSTALRAYFRRFWHCDPPRHLFSFSRKSFHRLMEHFDSGEVSYQISHYQVPWFENTITRQFFRPDKRRKGWGSVAIRLVAWVAVPVEAVLQLLRKTLLAVGLVSPGGIVLTVKKR